MKRNSDDVEGLPGFRPGTMVELAEPIFRELAPVARVEPQSASALIRREDQPAIRTQRISGLISSPGRIMLLPYADENAFRASYLSVHHEKCVRP